MLGLYLLMLETQQDKDIFTVLHDEYKQDMYKKAFYILKDHQLAEDVAQDAFLSIIRNFGIIKHKELCNQTRSYFVNIVKNKCIDLIRKRKRQNFVPFEELEGIIRDDKSDVERIFNGREIEKCFSMLPEHYQAILNMKYTYGHNDKEIAVLFNMTENNVKTRSSRAKKKLEQILRKEGVAY